MSEEIMHSLYKMIFISFFAIKLPKLGLYKACSSAYWLCTGHAGHPWNAATPILSSTSTLLLWSILSKTASLFTPMLFSNVTLSPSNRIGVYCSPLKPRLALWLGLIKIMQQSHSVMIWSLGLKKPVSFWFWSIV